MYGVIPLLQRAVGLWFLALWSLALAPAPLPGDGLSQSSLFTQLLLKLLKHNIGFKAVNHHTTKLLKYLHIHEYFISFSCFV